MCIARIELMQSHSYRPGGSWHKVLVSEQRFEVTGMLVVALRSLHQSNDDEAGRRLAIMHMQMDMYSQSSSSFATQSGDIEVRG